MEDACSAKRAVTELCDIVVRYVEDSGAFVKPTRNIAKRSVSAIGGQLRNPVAAEVLANADFSRTHDLVSGAT
jgi:hypothetical protein